MALYARSVLAAGFAAIVAASAQFQLSSPAGTGTAPSQAGGVPAPGITPATPGPSGTTGSGSGLTGTGTARPKTPCITSGTSAC